MNVKLYLDSTWWFYSHSMSDQCHFRPKSLLISQILIKLGLSNVLTYCIFPQISQTIYKSRVWFFFENLSKIENAYISQVGEKKNKKKFGQLCQKQNFAA